MRNSYMKKVMKSAIRFAIFVIVFYCFAFSFMFLINSKSDKPISTYLKEKCTRYCHNRNDGCNHYKSLSKAIDSLYASTIDNLLGQGFLGYKEINILLYVLLWPLLMLLLVFIVLQQLITMIRMR